MKRLPILMTASVSTRGMKGACFSDEEREDMYVGALAYYAATILPKYSEQRIVFAENSGWNLDFLAAKLKERMNGYDESRIEFVSLQPGHFDISRGKGYNEILLISEAAEHSEFVRESGGFFKVTGRYPIYNLDYFVDKASSRIYEKGYDMYCDIKDHKLYDWLRLGWNGHSFECRLFAITTDYWKKQFAEHYSDCNDYEGRLMEDVMFTTVKSGGVKQACALEENPTSEDWREAIYTHPSSQRNKTRCVASSNVSSATASEHLCRGFGSDLYLIHRITN